MRTIGIIGGMSWESTIPYYRWINELVRDRLGGLHSPVPLFDTGELHAAMAVAFALEV